MSKMHGRENDSVEVLDQTPKSEVALREEAILAFWREHDIFNKTIATPAGTDPVGDFTFYDGPPFATGLPHYGHILAGTIKDAIPRFWTMNGYRVRRNWGWDCHGLPLENHIEKRLGLATKRDIEEYGIKNFNEAAREAVLEYADDWAQIVPRMGRWVDMENDYKTMDPSYTESVWWAFKALHDKDLVFEGFKSMHLCPRCGTTLSNFEVNQGYKDIKDIAVTVKLPLLDEEGEVTDTSLLVWTTTPWTLPGNLAAAVNQEFEYVKTKIVDEAGESFVIMAKGRLAQLGDLEYKVIETMKGSELVGRKYQPPFPWLKAEVFDGKENAWTIYHADYVELGEEGTGAVHLAPAYGEDDMLLAKEHGVPIVHHVDETGHFKDFVVDFAGQLVKPKDDDKSGVSHLDADIEVVKALKANGTLFKKENITHSYPHCWRCETPLLNYATTSWFVDVPSLKADLLANNNKVKWVPEHVGTNRFGRWLEGARDWAVSRQRYWGAPLPIWKNPETDSYKVFGSLKDLQEFIPKSGNQYFLMRHGQAESNVNYTISTDIEVIDELTETGVKQTKEAAEKLREADVDLIIYSPFHRTKRTAEIIKETLGISEENFIVDTRIREIDIGKSFQGKDWEEHRKLYADFADEFDKEVAGVVETRQDIQNRVGEFLYELEEKYANKKILIIGHVSSAFAIASVAAGATPEQAQEMKKKNAFWLENAQVKELEFIPIPHNDNYQLDFHRPYIDEIALYEGETKLERVPDVFDCWFESGSMPYASQSFPRSQATLASDRVVTVPSSTTPSDPDSASADLIEKSKAGEQEPPHFPAQFIAEGLDQTRGWFYSLLVLGTALFGKSPFENVIVNGLVLAEDGKKMSKSLQNYPDPMELANRTGVDAMRFYLLSASIMRGEDLNFSEKDVLELQRKNIGRLHNVLAMYEQYANGTAAAADSTMVLDQWIVARLNQLIAESTAGYKAYELDKATRPLTDFIDDVSVWYLRRSRDRLKGDDATDKTQALATLRHVLRTLALVMAPAMPFYAEYLWRAVKADGDAESVHLAKWPTVTDFDPVVLGEMDMVREFVTTALELRTKAGLKVRQPLSKLTLNVEMEEKYKEIIADEINVKAVEADDKAADRVSLDTQLTAELVAEGAVRELMRAVQSKRKTEGLEPNDRIVLTIQTDPTGEQAIEDNRELLVKTVGAEKLVFAATDGEAVTLSQFSFTFAVEKI